MQRFPYVQTLNPQGQSRFFLTCPHASAFIPEESGDLGLTLDQRRSHRAYDPGASDLATYLVRALDAPAYLGTVSRLWAELNRTHTAPDFITPKCAEFPVKGNQNLTEDQRAVRAACLAGYHSEIYKALRQRCARESVLPTIVFDVHSFTPQPLCTNKRDFIFGVLSLGQEAPESLFVQRFIRSLTDELTRHQERLRALPFDAEAEPRTPVDWTQPVRWNEPYSLREASVRSVVMMHRYAEMVTPAFDYLTLEVRNDWLRTPESVQALGALVHKAACQAEDDAEMRASFVQPRRLAEVPPDYFFVG